MSIELQKFLFDSPPSRAALLRYTPRQPKSYRVQVYRNHSFELVEHTLGAYLDYAGLGVSFSYSGYDDSFSFLELEPDADLVLVWIDAGRYAPGAAAELMKERLAQLRLRYAGPLLLIPFGAEMDPGLSGVTVFSLKPLAEALGPRFTDERAKAVTGTALSGKAMLAISKELGLRYLPALLRPALKALVVDLDNTLYQGVLGEDGAERLVLTEGHRQLQSRLKELSRQGFFLCAASKNDQRDVDALFDARPDFPLRREDFTLLLASWAPKAEAVGQIAAFLNIHPDSMLFIDDNIGELTAMALAQPDMKLLLAWEDGGRTAQALDWFPGLFKLNATEDDAKRKADVQANRQRQQLQAALSQEDYIRSLGLRLRFACDKPAQAQRVAELANKTNQFIFNYRRYSLPQVEDMMASPDWRVVTVSLADRLSDSGLIGVAVGRAEADHVLLDECFVSCRALGRGIDDVIVLGALQLIADRLGRSRVRVLFQTGPRNAPAEAFVQKHLAPYLAAPADFRYELPRDLLDVAFE